MKPIHDFRFARNSNCYHICHNFQDIHRRNVHDLDVDIKNLSKSNVNMPIECAHMISYLMVIVIVASFFFNYLQDICIRNMRYLDFDLYNGSKSNVNTPFESPHLTCYLMAILICINHHL